MNGASPFPMMVSIAGSSVFGTGAVVRPLEVSSGGSVGLAGFNTSSVSQTRYNAMKALLAEGTDVTFARSAGAVTGRAIETNELLSQVLATQTPLVTQFPNTGLGNQLRMVARIINGRAQLNINREIFFVQIGGFDTHSGQLTSQANLFQQLSQACSSWALRFAAARTTWRIFSASMRTAGLACRSGRIICSVTPITRPISRS